MKNIDVPQKRIERKMPVAQHVECDTIYVNLNIHETIVS